MTTCAALARFAWCLNRGGCTQLFIACAPSPLRRGRQASNQLRRCKRPECASARWSGQWLLAWRRPWSSSGALRSACLLILSVAGPYQRLATYSMYHDKQLFSFDHHPSASGAAATSGGRRREPRTGGRLACESSPLKRYTLTHFVCPRKLINVSHALRCPPRRKPKGPTGIGLVSGLAHVYPSL